MITPPTIPFEVSDLPVDANERHEALMDVFGSMLFSIRNQTLDRVKLLVSSSAVRDQMGKLFRESYELASSLTPEDQAAALLLANASIDLFAKLFLTMLADKTSDHSFGTAHVVNFRLDLEVSEMATERTVIEETINQGGKDSLPNYWGRWLNKFGVK